MAHFNHELNYFIVFHLQTNGQTEVANRSLGNLLRTLVGKHTKSWDLKLAATEFAYNAIMNKTTRKSPHEIVYNFRPKQPINLIPMSDHSSY